MWDDSAMEYPSDDEPGLDVPEDYQDLNELNSFVKT
jgi:hypothetical protein